MRFSTLTLRTVLVLTLIFAGSVFAQDANTSGLTEAAAEDTCCLFDFEFSHQGLLTDSTGDPYEGTYFFLFEILDSLNNVLYSQSDSVDVTTGLFSYAIGSDGLLDPLIFSCPTWLKVTVNGSVISPDTKILSAPTAMVAYYACNFDTTGFAGPQGPAGPAGPAGPVGPAGPQGPPGVGWIWIIGGGTLVTDSNVVIKGNLRVEGTSVHVGEEVFEGGIVVPLGDSGDGGKVEIKPDGGLVVTDSAGDTTATLDGNGNLTTHGESNHHGKETFHLPDSLGGGTVEIGEFGLQVKDSAGNIVGIIDNDGNLVTAGASTHLGTETFHLPGGGTVIIGNNGITVTDAFGDTTASIDKDGFTTNAGGSVHYDPEVYHTDGGGTVTVGEEGVTVRNDPLGSPTAIIDQDGNLTTYGESNHHGKETFHLPLSAGGGSVEIGDFGISVYDSEGGLVGQMTNTGFVYSAGGSYHLGTETFDVPGIGQVEIGSFGITVTNDLGEQTASLDHSGNLTTQGESNHHGKETFHLPNGSKIILGEIEPLVIEDSAGNITGVIFQNGNISTNGDLAVAGSSSLAGGIQTPVNIGPVTIDGAGNINTPGKINAGGGVDPIMLESFYVVPGEDYEFGDVLIIDPQGKGYRKSYKANDAAVVGVVFEEKIDAAGELLGVVMGAAGPSPAILPGERQVVRIKVDASFGPIKPGDLLVTSPIAGHAMMSKSPQIGTVIGKALEALPSGQGLIRAFVMLQ